MNLTIKVTLPTDRSKTGTLTLIDPTTGLALFGPVPVLGRAAKNTAAVHGNPSASPLKPFGDTPAGTYDVARIVGNGDNTTRPVARFGQSGSIVMEPTGGDALTAKNNGRVGLLIHAGRHAFSAAVDAKALKPTNGCVRMLDFDMAKLIKAIKDNALIFPGTVTVEIGGVPGPQGDIDESVDDGDPPSTQGGAVVLPVP
ncbi:MAG: hypothetical protein L6Q69_17680 [Zoogloea sp.]|nr:hypothetical protein [Zoogloea sp.]